MQGSDFRGIPDFTWLLVSLAVVGLVATVYLIFNGFSWIINHVIVV